MPACTALGVKSRISVALVGCASAPGSSFAEPLEPHPPRAIAIAAAIAAMSMLGGRYLAVIVKSASPPSQADTADGRTLSGESVKELYTAEDLAARADPPGAPPLGVTDPIGRPGEYPFTRGVYESMYRGRLWTMRQFAGFGTSEETNERFHYLIEHGQTGLSTAFDMPSLMGHDSDHVRSLGEVGREGVAVDTLDDMQTLFGGIDLGAVSVSMTINAPAAIMLAFYVAAAEQGGDGAGGRVG